MLDLKHKLDIPTIILWTALASGLIWNSFLAYRQMMLNHQLELDKMQVQAVDRVNTERHFVRVADFEDVRKELQDSRQIHNEMYTEIRDLRRRIDALAK